MNISLTFLTKSACRVTTHRALTWASQWVWHQARHQLTSFMRYPLQWRHNECDGVSNHQPHDCLRNRLFKRKSKKTSKLRVTSFCAVNSPVFGEFPAQRASNTKNISIWWRHHVPLTIIYAKIEQLNIAVLSIIYNQTITMIMTYD